MPGPTDILLAAYDAYHRRPNSVRSLGAYARRHIRIFKPVISELYRVHKAGIKGLLGYPPNRSQKKPKSRLTSKRSYKNFSSSTPMVYNSRYRSKGRSRSSRRYGRKRAKRPKQVLAKRYGRSFASKLDAMMNKKLHYIRKNVSALTSIRTCRSAYSSRLLTGVNAQALGQIQGPVKSNLESCISSLRYFNPATPGTLSTVDLDVGTYSQDIDMQWWHSCQIRNNYQSPVEVLLWNCSVKVDTSIDPYTAITNGWSNNPSGGAITDVGALPTDADQLNELYKVKKVFQGILQPGAYKTFKCSSKRFTLDPSLLDNHTSSYQKAFHAQSYVIIVRGIISHDSALDEKGLSAGGVDILRKHVVKVHYSSGGAQLRDFDVNATFDTPTNGFVLSQHPVADNQAYSVS